ncbi:MAG TPA: AmmeMemoRadiSam system protein A [Burkholderiales bacterium]|nr:AmmeMemoRadiSam system protein A [Burkholderiales bacterium]
MNHGDTLLKIARASISSGLGFDFSEPPLPEALNEHGATFVTLTKVGQLRGCIGSLEAHRPIVVDTRQNALMAAFRDPRFPPLIESEYEAIRIEVSLLSKPEPVLFSNEREALLALRPGMDGVIFECGSRRSTFLPQVWESLPEAQAFLGELKRKAGFSAHFWSDGIRLSRYTVSKWKES